MKETAEQTVTATPGTGDEPMSPRSEPEMHCRCASADDHCAMTESMGKHCAPVTAGLIAAVNAGARIR